MRAFAEAVRNDSETEACSSSFFGTHGGAVDLAPGDAVVAAAARQAAATATATAAAAAAAAAAEEEEEEEEEEEAGTAPLTVSGWI